MKQKEIRNLMGMHLQFFAEGGTGEGGTGEGGEGQGTGEGAAGGDAGEGQGKQQDVSFDDFLKTGENQAEFDRRVQKAVDTAVGKAKEKWQILTDDKVSEAEKLAKMTKEEKSAYMQQKKETELSQREAAITKRELMAEAKNTLAEKKLPVSLAETLNYSDADACKKSIEAVEKAFKEALEAAVEERMKGGDPLKKGNETNLNDIILAAMSEY